MVRDRILKLKKVAGTQNVADALTKSIPYPSFSKHREYLQGSRVPFEAFWTHIGLLPHGSPASQAWRALQARRAVTGSNVIAPVRAATLTARLVASAA
eukprot:2263642-Rhodomonas_salina.1